MATKIGKISSIKKNYGTGNTLEAALSKNGYDRFPGTCERLLPFKEKSGKYRTGLDPEASYLNRLSPEEKNIVVKDIIEAKTRLEEATGLDLSPRSDYYNFAKPISNGGDKVGLVKLYMGDNLFSFADPMKEITYRWVAVHPLIASSMRAYEEGLYPANTQFFVNNEETETDQTYKQKTLINKAIAVMEDMEPDTRRKIARLLGLPVSDSSKEKTVYNLLDAWIKQEVITTGDNKGKNPITLFNNLAKMEHKLLTLKDTVEQAISHGIYRIKTGGRIHEGEVEIFKSKEELVDFLHNDKNQDHLLALEDKLAAKKSVLVN